MAEKIGLQVQVEAAKAAQSVGDLRKVLEDAKKQASEIGKAFGQNSDEFKAAQQQVAKIGAEFSKFGNNKADLREAKVLLQGIIEAYGATSKEAIEAAKAAANFKDNIGDADKLIAAFDPDAKFNAFSGALQSAVGGFAALQGAMGLFGVEGDAVEEVLLKVQSALALSEGVNSILEAKESFQNLGNVIINQVIPAFKGIRGALMATGIGAIVVAVGYLIANFEELKQSLGLVDKAQDALNDTMDDYRKGATSAIEKVNEVRTAFELAKNGTISKNQALKTYNDTLGDSLGRTNDLAVAEKMLADKAEAYIKITGLKAQANALFAKSAEYTAKALTAASDDQTNWVDKGLASVKSIFGGYNSGVNTILEAQEKGVENTKKTSEENAKVTLEAGNNLLKQAGELSKQYNINDQKQTIAHNESKNKIAKNSDKSTIEQKKKYYQEQLKQQREYNEAAIKLNEELNQKISEKNFTDEQKEIAEATRRLAERLEILQLGNQGTINALVTYNDEVKAIRDKYDGDQQISQQSSFQKSVGAAYEAEKNLTGIYKDNAAARAKFREYELDNEEKYYQAASSILGSLSDIVGRETVAGKSFAVAQATIDTYAAALSIYKNTARNPITGALPGFAIAQMAATIVAGLATVKKIVSVPVPGRGSGGSGGFGGLSAPSLPRPTAPSQAVANVTTLDRDAINALANQALRAYVVESDITNSQGRIQRIKRSAILG